MVLMVPGGGGGVGGGGDGIISIKLCSDFSEIVLAHFFLLWVRVLALFFLLWVSCLLFKLTVITVYTY